MNILKQIYNEGFDGGEKDFSSNEGYQKAAKTAGSAIDLLDRLLGKEEKRLLDELLEAENKMYSIAAEMDFESGFRLGARLMQETIQ